jgi:rhodanese-related sulfurtransferase
MTKPAFDDTDPTLLERCRQFIDDVPDDLNCMLPAELYARILSSPESLFLLDNRTSDAYRAGHVPGAINIPLKEILSPENLARIPVDREIIVCCWVGHTASQLVTVLQLLGYHARCLKYGMGQPKNPSERVASWLSLSLPVQTGPDP